MIDALEEAGVKKTAVSRMDFDKDQDMRRVSGSPMLTIDLDNFAALMEVFKAYEKVEMQFKDSNTGIYFRAQGHTHLPYMEAILSPTIQYVNGKTCLR